MRPFTLIALGSLALAATPSPAQAVPPSGVVTLAQLRDRFRVLLVFAASPTGPQLEIQLRTLNQHAPEAAERDLVPIALPYASPSPTRTTLSSQEADALRRRLGIAPSDFAVVLLGKDGGEKLRSPKPLSMQRLNAVIDAMPMRQDEIQQRRNPPAR